jgi:hypothetical protein
MVKAHRVWNRKLVLGNVAVQESIWAVPQPVPGCAHGYKYSLALIVNGECILRYDNERGKGDHRHFMGQESAYAFESLERLMDDFQAEVQRVLQEVKS